MPLRKLEPRGPLIEEDDVARFEQLLGTRLPFDYRAFLVEWNGGVPIPDAYNFGGVTTLISRFFSLGATNFLHCLATRREAMQTRVSPDLLPIAVDLATNLVCLGVEGDRRGHVYYVSLQRDARLFDRRPLPIAVSFAYFVRDLHAMSEGQTAS